MSDSVQAICRHWGPALQVLLRWEAQRMAYWRLTQRWNYLDVACVVGGWSQGYPRLALADWNRSSRLGIFFVVQKMKGVAHSPVVWQVDTDSK